MLRLTLSDHERHACYMRSNSCNAMHIIFYFVIKRKRLHSKVLRAQPQNLLQFITDHLAALLVARENLFVAARVCDDVCKTGCYPELEDELREIGLSEEDVEKTVKVVTDFFESGGGL